MNCSLIPHLVQNHSTRWSLGTIKDVAWYNKYVSLENEGIMKKVVYIVLWILLGLILSTIVHALIEIIYLRLAEKNDVVVSWTLNQSCSLPLWLIILLPALGVVFGVVLGLASWQKLYVEKVRGNNPKFFSR